MENLNVVEAKKAPISDKPVESGVETAPSFEKVEHAEAVALVEKHRDFFEHYAKGKIKVEPAPAELKTFAFDLEKNTIYVNSMFYKKLGLSEEKTVFATLHEIEHFMEKLQLLGEQQKKGKGGRTVEESGEKKFENYLKRIKGSRAFSLMDNCVADIRENRTVTSKTNKGMGDLEKKIYKDDLFTDTDFTSEPRHIQFCNAVLREARLPGEKCQVAPEVRKALDEVSKTKGLMDIMTNPETPMSLRLKLQDKYIWPKVEALLEKDKEDKKKPKKDGQPKDGKGDGKDDEKPGQKGDKKGQEGESAESKPQDGQGEGQENEETDPDKIFEKDYKKALDKFPEAVPLEEIDKAFKEWKESQKGKGGADRADEEYAKKIGVEKEDLQEYRRIVESLQTIVSPETDVSLIEELKNLFSRIISKRLKQKLSPKYPVEEGDELADPAQLVADVKSGNLQPKVWEDTEIKEKKGDRFGEVEITLVCDRSSSMGEGQKASEQRKSAVLVMEVLKDFADMCEEEKRNVDKPLEVKSEIYTFASSSEDGTPLKKMSKELGEAERINVLKKLNDLPGRTTDFNCLEAIDSHLNDEVKNKIRQGELKKIVVVFTDGGSDSPARVQAVLKSLREDGVVVVGVGITEEGRPVESTYAPKALVVPDVAKLPFILGDLLKEHLKDL
ncbi:MAG: vWA domain-containing protein [Candidatus Taylorbacteria bacterium]